MAFLKVVLSIFRPKDRKKTKKFAENRASARAGAAAQEQEAGGAATLHE
jgi:hypothetical protein